MSHRYRAHHVGSLLRPAEIQKARRDPATPPDQLRALEDQHILRVLKRQQELGFELFTDGEFRRGGFQSDFHDSVDGLDMNTEVARTWKSESEAAAAAKRPKLSGIVVEKIRQKRRLTEDQVAFLKQHCPGDMKVTLPTANQFPAIAFEKGRSEVAYKNHSEFLWDVVPIIRAEIQALASEGVKCIQIDAPRYSYYIDPKWRNYVQEEMGMDPDQALDEAIRADNACLEGAPRDGIVYAMHLCRGNNRSQWYAEGGYDPIAEKLFNELNVDAFLLEYESERAGTFAPLRFVPSTKTAVLGLISSKQPELEDPAQLTSRIEEASRILPLDNLALSPQCGFASSLEGNLLTEDQQWAKLQLVVDTARKVWQTA